MARRSAQLLVSGAVSRDNAYPERRPAQLGTHDRVAGLLARWLLHPLWHLVRPPVRQLAGILPAVAAHAAAMQVLDDAGLRDAARHMRKRLRRDGFGLALVGECFALISEAAYRAIGHRHYPSQFQAGWALLQGRLVEMQTGEGKTFAATLPACVVALAGHPVHVITVNDYLSHRDAAEMGVLYGFLGLSVGVVAQGMENAERAAAYQNAIVYCTNKEVAFDYLRDKIAHAEQENRVRLAVNRLDQAGASRAPNVLRGLCFAIVDEADSVFIDEARTPLVLSASRSTQNEQPVYARALEIARALTVGSHYSFDARYGTVGLTEAGRAEIASQCAGAEGVWLSVRGREELIAKALRALLLFVRDRHYIVADDAVQIIDESTGRSMPDRSWEHGLHQLIETKEGCTLTDRRETLARITYQRLFRRYLRLSGMTGTAREVAGEIRAVFDLDVVAIPLHRPARRRHMPLRCCLDKATKYQTVADVVARMAADGGRPVLIGTRSVAASEEISAVLRARAIDHALLNARQDSAEADIIAQAGLPGRVTVATNMAGRGTDIRLSPEVAAAGGLHVVLTEFHESRRIDRQLFGRCARQGDAGSYQEIISLDDDIFAYVPLATAWVRRLAADGRVLPNMVVRGLVRLAQGAAERRATAQRMRNFHDDERMATVLAFTGQAME